MSHDILDRYLRNIEQAVRTLAGAHVECYQEEFVSANRLNLKLRIRFQSGHLFEVSEAVIVERGKREHLRYRYHFQDALNNIVFRYDNVPHFTKLDSFPHHRHTREGVLQTSRPELSDVIKEVRRYFSNGAVEQ
ncbi:MAG TPA: DUF6516 family protein [Syntrophobacteraceae bacterium]|nr:DUF6516 family protein [Syntrophobacteraceae bacterium]